MVAVTVQVNAEPEGKRLDTYAARFARRSVPPVDKPEHLSRAKTPEVMYSDLGSRTGRRDRDPRNVRASCLQSTRALRLRGRRMLTVVGVLHRPDAAATVTACAFDELSLYPAGRRAIRHRRAEADSS